MFLEGEGGRWGVLWQETRPAWFGCRVVVVLGVANFLLLLSELVCDDLQLVAILVFES
jgi:hypothetical protein